MRPQKNEYPSFYETYVSAVKEEEPLLALEKSAEELHHFIPLLPEARSDYRYAPGKWSVKELLQHMIDTERIMAYRALTIARADKVALPGFDENAYAEVANVDYRSIAELREELQVVRKSSLALFGSFDAAALKRNGVANNNPVSVLAIAYIIAGHQKHHFKIIRERYFPDVFKSVQA